ncbi:peptide chain release factor N(5)-glutamine methyltransferase [Rhodoferax sp.]|uniref:peptide chain release factor N(5)-glutamine methyltransferase n=1 Tax=Rhodoferax sp. TaxID=50421 RepID=UPI00262377CC|nr:peptide chain release factor N(5)-glutamine methyltransferase [Rhodoferax sp.]MDD2917381.1 peptide chain release factor N(5)-glutamine methyltransferase [Rhodoferax sp.]
MNTVKSAQPTVGQTLASLQSRGLDRLDAQLLSLHVLDRPETQRGWLLAHDIDPLPPERAASLENLVQRRLAGEPLAYLTGHKEFFGLDLRVDARVLVPRPDTETLVSWALETLDGGHRVLDLGTGSGAIALALKASQPTLEVHATDLSTGALAVAQSNAQRLKLDVNFHQGAWLAALPDASESFKCIVANPPYIAELDQHLATLKFEPAQALSSGEDGLDDLRQIITQAPRHLARGGWLLLEHGYDQAQAVRNLLTQAGFAPVQSRRDLAGIERCSGGQLNPKPNP